MSASKYISISKSDVSREWSRGSNSYDRAVRDIKKYSHAIARQWDVNEDDLVTLAMAEPVRPRLVSASIEPRGEDIMVSYRWA